MRPLTEAANIIKEEPDFKQADVVFVTDGESTIDNEWLKKFIKDKEVSQFNVISILIGVSNSECGQFSDKVVTIDDIAEDDKALSTMFTI